MKILRLDLIAFGPFSGRSLSLDQGRHGLHLVYGPNEAGKSSSLRGLYHWLYGIPNSSTDNFLHPYGAMRIGGVLESSRGTCLEIIRKKGQKNTLLAGDGQTVVDDGKLAEMLGGVDSTTFSRQYGITYEELKKGGRAIVEGGGDLGEILFSAGTGLSELGQVQKGLAGEGDLLFKKAGRNQRISLATAELMELRKQIREASLSTAEWEARDDALRQSARQQQILDEELQSLRTESSRCERILTALPLIRQRHDLMLRLKELHSVPNLPEGFAEQRQEAQRQIRTQRELIRNGEATLAALQLRIDSVNVPEELLQNRTQITRLHTELGGYEKAARDLPQLVSRVDSLRGQLSVLFHDLGHAPELVDPAMLSLSRPQRQRIQLLAGDWRALTERENAARQQESKLQAALKLLDRQLEELPDSIDVTELQQVIRRSQKSGDLDGLRTGAQHQLAELEQQSVISHKQLRLWDGTLEELECLAVPSVETIDLFDHEFREGEAERKRISDRIGESSQKIQRIDRQLEQLRLQHDLPDLEDLHKAREQRDRLWLTIRQVLGCSDQEEVGPAVSSAGIPALAGEFQRQVKEADYIVDRLRNEAERVAEQSTLSVDRQACEAERGSQQQVLELLDKENQERLDRWKSIWKPCRIEPLSPREMRSWVKQRDEVVALSAQLRQQRGLVERLNIQLESIRSELLEALPEQLRNELTSLQDLARLVERAEALISQAEQHQRQRQKQEDRQKSLREELVLAGVELDSARQNLAAWQEDWSLAVSALKLGREATPVEATSLLESVDQILQIQKEMDELQQRISGIDRDAKQFEQAVRQILEQVAEDLVSLPVSQSISTLSDRLAKAIATQVKQEEWNEALLAEQERVTAARSTLQQEDRELDRLCQLAGCLNADELPEIEQQVQRQRELLVELDSLTRQLQHQAGSLPLKEFEQEAEGVDQDELNAQLVQLHDRIGRAETEKTEAARAHGEHAALLRQMDGGPRAAAAQEQAEQLLAGIRSDAEQYIRLRLASHLLQRTVERFRESSQGPVLKRASTLFSRLTLGAYSGIRPEYDDKGAAILVGVREADQREVRVDGMSEGTCDQLYLALRLALLEQSLQSREPLPLIVDDILVMFDDQRATAALEILVELSEKTQVILFTHHQHVVELARQLERDDAVFVHSLSS